jgi:hypothetical protein
MRRTAATTRITFGRSARTACTCGEPLQRCDTDDDAERVFVCVACRSEFVSFALPRTLAVPARRRRSVARRTR